MKLIYWRTNNGGWNKTHNQVERAARLDSFELAQVNTWGELFFGGTCKSVEVYFFPEDGKCTIAPHGAEIDLEVSEKRNGYGGSQFFFLCPHCGRRVRYLYLLTGRQLWCRECSRLNYRSQQQTRGTMTYYDKGMKLAKEHLAFPEWATPRDIDGFTFCEWIPERPRYMHSSTYQRYLRRFMRYRRQHAARTTAELLRLLSRI